MVREQVKREKPVKTKTGIIIYHDAGNDFKIDLPNGVHYYGGVTTEVLNRFFKALAEDKGLTEAIKLAFKE